LFAQEFERAVERTRGSGQAAERLEKLEGERRSARRASFGGERPGTEDAHAEEAVYRSGQGPQVAAPAVHLPSDDAASASATPPSFEEASASGGGASSTTAAESTPTLAAPANAAAAPAVASLASSVRVAAEVVAAASPAGAAPPPLATPPVERAEAPRAPQSTGATSAPERAGTAVLERAEEVLRQIQLHLTPGVKRLTLELQPAELGRMAIQLALRGGKLTAIVRGERAETLEALEQHEPGLRAVLAGRGIAIDSVRFELGFDRSRTNASASTSGAVTTSAPVPPPFTPPASTPRRDGALDLYA
jgi:flagellar hook-length control protein FliK